MHSDSRSFSGNSVSQHTFQHSTHSTRVNIPAMRQYLIIIPQWYISTTTRRAGHIRPLTWENRCYSTSSINGIWNHYFHAFAHFPTRANPVHMCLTCPFQYSFRARLSSFVYLVHPVAGTCARPDPQPDTRHAGARVLEAGHSSLVDNLQAELRHTQTMAQ